MASKAVFFFFLLSCIPSRCTILKWAREGHLFGPEPLEEVLKMSQEALSWRPKRRLWCEGPGKSSQLPKDGVMVLKEASDCPVACLLLLQ